MIFLFLHVSYTKYLKYWHDNEAFKTLAHTLNFVACLMHIDETSNLGSFTSKTRPAMVSWLPGENTTWNVTIKAEIYTIWNGEFL